MSPSASRSAWLSMIWIILTANIALPPVVIFVAENVSRQQNEFAFGAESDVAIPVLSEVHQATTRYLCAVSIFELPFSLIWPHGIRSGCQKLLLGKLKHNRDGCIYFYRFTVQQVWSITPLSDCINGS